MRQDNTQEWHSVIEISIKEVISGVIAEVLWFVFGCVCVRERKRGDSVWGEKKNPVDGLNNPSFFLVE